jgi:hypothetical protein
MKQKWNDLFALMEEASKYPNRSTFAKQKRNAYNAANTMGLLDVFFPIKTCGKWEAIEEAERHVSRTSLRRASPAVYAAMARNSIRGYSLLDYWFPRRAFSDKPLRDSYMPPMTKEELQNMLWK